MAALTSGGGGGGGETTNRTATVQKDHGDDNTLVFTFVGQTRRASLAASSEHKLGSDRLCRLIAGFSPACSPNFYLLRFKPINRLCCRIRAQKLSSTAHGRRGRVRPDLRGHMTVLLRLSLLLEVACVRGVSSFHPSGLPRRRRLGHASTFPGCEFEPFSHCVFSPAINRCQVITLCENSLSPVSPLMV